MATDIRIPISSLKSLAQNIATVVCLLDGLDNDKKNRFSDYQRLDKEYTDFVNRWDESLKKRIDGLKHLQSSINSVANWFEEADCELASNLDSNKNGYSH